MKRLSRLYRLAPLVLACLGFGTSAQTYDAQNDWAYLNAYRAKNARLTAHPFEGKRVVFMGDSITEFWSDLETSSPPHTQFVNRGISGQTTPQMLLRFRADVIDLHPAVVVILAGTNDVAGNNGPATPAMIEDNIASMCELAASHHIAVVLSSIVPAAAYPWAPSIHPIEPINTINIWLKRYAKDHSLTYLDYNTALNDGAGGLPQVYSEDGVHPNGNGYGIMMKTMQASLAQLLSSRP